MDTDPYRQRWRDRLSALYTNTIGQLAIFIFFFLAICGGAVFGIVFAIVFVSVGTIILTATAYYCLAKVAKSADDDM